MAQSIRSREKFGETLRLLADAQKAAARGAPAYSRYVNRRLGRYIAAWAYRAGLSPNAVTGISAALTFGGISVLVLARPTVGVGLLVSVLLALGYAFDSADGQVARLRGGGSVAGEWLDHHVDAVKVVALPLAVLVGLYRHETAPEEWLFVPLVAAVVSSVLFFSMILTEQLRRQTGTPSLASTQSRRASLLRSLIVLPTDYGVLCIIFAFWGVANVFLVLFVVQTALSTLFLVAALARWFREMRDAGRGMPGKEA